MSKRGKKLAEEHWKYVGDLCEKMYKDAFIHGYKHGQEDAEEEFIQQNWEEHPVSEYKQPRKDSDE